MRKGNHAVKEYVDDRIYGDGGKWTGRRGGGDLDVGGGGRARALRSRFCLFRGGIKKDSGQASAEGEEGIREPRRAGSSIPLNWVLEGKNILFEGTRKLYTHAPTRESVHP